MVNVSGGHGYYGKEGQVLGGESKKPEVPPSLVDTIGTDEEDQRGGVGR